MKITPKCFALNFILIFCLSLFISCKENNHHQTNTNAEENMKTICPHSYALKNATANHLDLNITIDFENKKIFGKATYTLNSNQADSIIFDTYDLEIRSVTLNGNERKTDFKLGEKDAILGTPLIISLIQDTRTVTIEYTTSANPLALQWLEPQQTAGKRYPFLYTQGQAILTRSWIPIQDSPGIRITYNAEVHVPTDLLVVMSATNPIDKNNEGVYHFTMDKPIPCYLIALAAGDLVYEAISDRTGIYAEPVTLEEAVWEFADMEKMVKEAEDLYGPYLWEQFDVLVLPPSFPFGGMENPRLTFATPTVIAGDRSLTALIAHELAHSWSGNLVTNATWNDFWINEGFTVYFERRIMEKLYGEEIAEMHTYIGYQDLLSDMELLGKDSPDTRLKLNMAGRNPDDGVTAIAYEKGYFLIAKLEELVGREKFDQFLREYFTYFKFNTIDTEQFLEYLYENLLDPMGIDYNIHAWVYQSGLPEDFIAPVPHKFLEVDSTISGILRADPKAIDDTREWETNQWLYFIRTLSPEMSNDDMRILDLSFGFSDSGNSEIKGAWFITAVKSGYYIEIKENIEDFLVEVGRRKFLTPIYQALIDRNDHRLAADIYEKARPNYHAVSRNTIDGLLHYDAKNR